MCANWASPKQVGHWPVNGNVLEVRADEVLVRNVGGVDVQKRLHEMLLGSMDDVERRACLASILNPSGSGLQLRCVNCAKWCKNKCHFTYCFNHRAEEICLRRHSEIQLVHQYNLGYYELCVLPHSLK